MNINATLIGQSVAFFIFVLFCMKFVWPPVIAALQERQKKIADGLDAANRAARDLELGMWPSCDQLLVLPPVWSYTQGFSKPRFKSGQVAEGPALWFKCGLSAV